MSVALLVWVQLPFTDAVHQAGGDVRAPQEGRGRGMQAVPICCAWDQALGDGDLTFALAGGDPATQEVLRSAVRAWDDVLPAVTLTEIAWEGRRPDLAVVYFDRRGKGTDGEAVTHFEGRGLIAWVDIAIRGAPAPANSGPLEMIMKHELGHGLGLGHATFKGNLMSPAVNPSPAPIPACVVEAVVEANDWKLIDRSSRPHRPHLERIDCV